ncbi:type I glutamate--ammonia ligase [Streptomyces cavernicola]|uniref:Glutamine synthetase family protein n=1 Tax=Streptomyces cavernicola TaxID=3043613 RepID=A0ABT6S7K7_9ACTN|nr:glutamine synthetase family protein [Streptomyces sp. B-S-A6]MDI3404082.1 glutamine synthetase family protein [Streptomyces sp. B-S-A6]
MSDAATVFVATCDLSGQVRGRAVPHTDEEDVLRTGTGWVPANLGITSFGPIAPGTAFGSTGDLRLLPDEATRTDIPADPDAGKPGLRLYLADQTRLDGEPWACCPRTFLRTALDELRETTGLSVTASFEHEFTLEGLPATRPFSLQRLRAAEPFGSDLLALLDAAGLRPENWLPEYGDDQFEITLRPADALTAADRAVLLRELVRDLAGRRGLRAGFAPLPDPAGSGNGVHIHLSLQDADGRPVLHDPARPGSLSAPGARFAAGILRHARALTAWTAPSPTSYLRLTPHRWSVGGVFLAERNREALLRICPTSRLGGGEQGRQFNLEYRAADATANPWLALGVLVRAGLAGLSGSAADYPQPVVWPENADESELADVPALPGTLPEALQALEADKVACSWFDPDLLTTHLAVRHHELDRLDGLDDAARARETARVH